MDGRMQAPARPAAFHTVLSALIVVISLWHVSQYWGYVVDDTFINLRYARSLVEGYGLVFNPGERVEGYTNICFVLLAALLLKLGIDPVTGLKCVSAALGVLTLWMTAKVERTVAAPEETKKFLPLTALLLLPLGAFVYWAFCPMGTMLFTALFVAALLVLLHERSAGMWRGSGLIFVLLALTRPEGVYAFGVCTVVFVLVDYAHNRTWNHVGRHVLNLVLFGILFGAYITWRYQYYGNLLPNTFYAKVTGGSGHVPTGLAYLGDWLRAFPLFGATLLLPLALSLPGVSQRLHQPVLVTMVYLITLTYVLAVVALGGDFMPFFRFFVPIMPLCALLVASVFQAVPLRWRAGGRTLAAVLALHVICAFFTEQPYRAFVAHRTAVVGKESGEWLAEHVGPGDWIAVNTAGSLPYYSGLPTIDMLGLTDAEIARRPIFITSKGWAGHRRGWGEYVLRRRPRIILWYNSSGSAQPFYLSDHELAAEPLFRFFYQLRTVTVPPRGGAAAEATPVRRFTGFPFGFNAEGKASMADLGLSAEFTQGIVGLTTFFEGPIRLTYFEVDGRDEAFWEEAVRLRNDLEVFVDRVAELWMERSLHQPPADSAARSEVEAMCDDAYDAIEGGDHARARAILDEAARRNQVARSPMVYQYIANLAVLSRNLLAAVSAQKEALRLAPGNQLYRENLRHLLTVPYKDFGHRVADLRSSRR